MFSVLNGKHLVRQSLYLLQSALDMNRGSVTDALCVCTIELHRRSTWMWSRKPLRSPTIASAS
jgi:hypothetical protein